LDIRNYNNGYTIKDIDNTSVHYTLKSKPHNMIWIAVTIATDIQLKIQTAYAHAKVSV
jgi:hypothetical protein